MEKGLDAVIVNPGSVVGPFDFKPSRMGATVLDLYQQTPAVEDALALMVRAYRRMELPQLASDAERVLSTNFPNSDYLVENSVQDKKKRWYWPD